VRFTSDFSPPPTLSTPVYCNQETVDNVYGYTPLLLACFTNDKRMVLYLLSKGADIKAKDRDTGTCMHIAAEGGYVEVVKALTTCDKVELGATTKVQCAVALACLSTHCCTYIHALFLCVSDWQNTGRHGAY